jgi:hypothetical protein
MMRVVKPGGACIVSTVANICPKDKLNVLLKKDTNPKGWKQTGWSRDKKHITRLIPPEARIARIFNLEHDKLPPVFRKNGRNPAIGRLIVWLSTHIYPLTNTTVAFHLVKR